MDVEELNRWLTIALWMTLGLIIFILLVPTIFRKQIEKEIAKEIEYKRKKSKSKRPKRKEAK